MQKSSNNLQDNHRIICIYTKTERRSGLNKPPSFLTFLAYLFPSSWSCLSIPIAYLLGELALSSRHTHGPRHGTFTSSLLKVQGGLTQDAPEAPDKRQGRLKYSLTFWPCSNTVYEPYHLGISYRLMCVTSVPFFFFR